MYFSRLQFTLQPDGFTCLYMDYFIGEPYRMRCLFQKRSACVSKGASGLSFYHFYN